MWYDMHTLTYFNKFLTTIITLLRLRTKNILQFILFLCASIFAMYELRINVGTHADVGICMLTISTILDCQFVFDRLKAGRVLVHLSIFYYSKE